MPTSWVILSKARENSISYFDDSALIGERVLSRLRTADASNRGDSPVKTAALQLGRTPKQRSPCPCVNRQMLSVPTTAKRSRYLPLGRSNHGSLHQKPLLSRHF